MLLLVLQLLLVITASAADTSRLVEVVACLIYDICMYIWKYVCVLGTIIWRKGLSTDPFASNFPLLSEAMRATI